jgi:DNA-binding GntR family transcriptional regulator
MGAVGVLLRKGVFMGRAPAAAVEQAGLGVDRCLAQVRAMVLSGELLPGQKIQQELLAKSLGMSRVPVREALSRLHSEGVVDHKPNTGYTVARFNSEDLSEIYMMRRLLETEVLKTIDLGQIDVGGLRALHGQMIEAAAARDPEEFQELNQEFHFTILSASPLEVVIQELERLWYMSAFYRAMYLYEPETTSHLIEEHQGIICAVEAGDIEELIRKVDAHRSQSERSVVQRLGRSRPAPGQRRRV